MGFELAGRDRRAAGDARATGPLDLAATAASCSRCRSSRRRSWPAPRSARSSSTTRAGSASRAARRRSSGARPGPISGRRTARSTRPTSTTSGAPSASTAERVDDPTEVAPAVRRALASGGPSLVHVTVDRDLAIAGPDKTGWWDAPSPEYHRRAARAMGGRRGRGAAPMTAVARDVRRRSPTSARRCDDRATPCRGASIGTVPILWNNVDLADLRLGTDAADDPRRDRPDRVRGHPARHRLSRRARRCTRLSPRAPPPGRGLPVDPGDGRRTDAPTRWPSAASGCACCDDGGGEVLCDRPRQLARPRGRARVGPTEPGTPALTDAGWAALLETVHSLGDRGRRGRPSGGVPSPRRDVHRDAGRGRPARRRPRPERRSAICLDVGHYTVGGGDPVAALRDLGERVTHVHLKDVDPAVLDGLRAGSIAGFERRRPGAPLHRARRRRARPRRRARGAGRPRLRRLADGRAGQHAGGRRRRARRSGGGSSPLPCDDLGTGTRSNANEEGR